MESTGVYWMPLFELLESRGFTVLLVNARHVKVARRPPGPRDFSYTCTECPANDSARAHAAPAMPAPITATL